MSISGIGSYDQLSQLYGIQGVDQIFGLDNTSSSSSTTSSSTSSSDKANFSKMGQMMSQLMNLSTTDPDKFKQLAQKISDDLTTEASSASTAQKSQMLTDMAGKFSTAAQTGSMDSLRPDGPPPSMSSSGSSSSSQASGLQDVFSQVSNTISADLSNAGISTQSSASGIGHHHHHHHGGNSSMDAMFSQVNSTIAADLSNAGISVNSSALQGPEAMGEFMKQLQALQTSDPEKFKELTAKISSDLTTQAQSTTDAGAAHMLSDLSSQFSQASSTGSTDSLKPQGPPPPPPSGQSASGDQSGSSYNSSGSGQNSLDMLEYLQSIMANDVSGMYSSSFWNSLGTTTTTA